jgi:dTDP-4-dehydrorhamnose reductase
MRLLLTGASGQLGGYLLQELQTAGADVVAWSGTRQGRLFGTTFRPIDLTIPDHVAAAFREAKPSLVVHSAAITTVAACYRDPRRANQVNVNATALLTELAAEAGVRFVFPSTDLVFDGDKGSYCEVDAPSPLSVYGRSKLEAEKPVLAYSRGVVARLSLLYGPTLVGQSAFFDDQVAALQSGRPVTLFEDEWRTPLDLETAAQGILAIAESAFAGLIHLGGPERLSRLEMGNRLAAYLGCDPQVIVPAKRDQLQTAEPRPSDVSLDSSLWRKLFPNQPWRTWHEAMPRLLTQPPTPL